MDLSSRKYVDAGFDQKQKRSILRRDDLLTNIVGASIGRTAVFESDEHANINQAVCVIRLKSSVNNYFVLYALSAPAILDFMHGEKVDVARANLSLKDIGNVPVLLPEKGEQDEIVRRVKSLLGYADRFEARYTPARAQVERLTPALLNKAFRGELVPQDPNDEPASVLLERIRAARAAAPTKPRRRRAAVGYRKAKKPEVLMLKRKDVQDTHLAKILKEPGPLTAESLWSASQLDIDDFYDQLKDEEARGLLRENRGQSSTASRTLEAVA